MQGRRIAGGALSLFALGVAVGLVAFRRPLPPPTSAPAARACPPPKPDARAKAKARRAAAKACLRRKLPRDFDVSKSAAVYAAVHECLGKTPRKIGENGIRRFRIGRDTRNGEDIDLILPCGVHCPSITTKPAIVYSYGYSLEGCLCMGGKPIVEHGSSYEGCSPAPRLERGVAFSIEPAPGRKDLYRAMGGRWGTRLGETGVQGGDILLSVDGRPVHGAAEARKVMLRFPYDPPRSVTVEGADSKKTQIRYVGWDVIRRLAKHMHHVRYRGRSFPPICCDAGKERLTIHQGLTIAPRCHDGVTKAWLAFAQEVGRTHATPGVSRGLGDFPGCKGLFRTPTTYRGLSGGRVVVVKYVGWLGFPIGGGPDGGT